MKTKTKLLLIALLFCLGGFTEGVYADDGDQSNTVTPIAQIQNPDTSLPSGVTYQKGILGDIMSKMFRTDNKKIATAFLHPFHLLMAGSNSARIPVWDGTTGVNWLVPGTLRDNTSLGIVGVGGAAVTGQGTLQVMPGTTSGKVSSNEYCDENGASCFDPTAMASGNMGGAGTANYLAKFTASSTLGPSIIYEDGTNVGVGTTSLSQKLTVNGNIALQALGYMYMGAQYLYGDNASALYFNSNHSTMTQLVFRDLEGTQYGRVYGDTNGTQFGLLDGDGEWSYLAIKDTSTALAVNNSTKMLIDSSGNVRTDNSNKRALTRTVPTTVNDAVDIGSFTLSNGGGNLEVSVIVPAGSFSISKKYLLPIGYAETANTWTIAQPISDSGAYGGNNFELDINVNNGTTSLRIRRTVGATAGTAYVVIKQEGINTDAFTASTTVAAVAAPTTFYNAAQIRQVDGSVGIATVAPTQKLDVTGNIRASGDVLAARLCNAAGGSCVSLPITAGNIDGGGSANLVARFSDTDTLSTGIIQDNGTNAGINAAPAVGAKLTITGTSGNTALSATTSGANYAINGTSAAYYGVYGKTNSASYAGVQGNSADDSAYGLLGHANIYGVYGYGNTDGYGAYGYNVGNNHGVAGVTAGTAYGVYGQSQNAGYGGVIGYTANSTLYGILGHSNTYSVYGNGRIESATDVRAPIFYDTNASYYLDPASTSNLNEVYTNNWIRVNGNYGMYFQSWGGGWTMTDSTYIRSYGDKTIYTGGNAWIAGSVKTTCVGNCF